MGPNLSVVANANRISALNGATHTSSALRSHAPTVDVAARMMVPIIANVRISEFGHPVETGVQVLDPSANK